MAETQYIGGQAPGEGRYALAEIVGRGGFATVWRARTVHGPKQGYFGRTQAGQGREVAVKVIPVYSAKDRSRALREGQIAQELKHKNVVETIEVIPGDLEVYLVTEFVCGEPLDDAARHYSIEQVMDVLAQTLEALDYAHSRGVIHRDVKPQNALVDGRGRVKLTDFGVAYRAGDTRLTQVGYAVGTPGYIAPEILDGDDPSALTDIYAVGATARALLSYQPEELPPRLSEFVGRTTSPNPDHRPQSAAAALKLLTGRHTSSTGTRKQRPPKESEARPGRLAEHALRATNGLAAGWLGYLGAGLILDGSQALGVAAGFGVLGYLLPRLGALGVIVALAVALVRGQQAGLGFAVLLPVIGGLWVATGSVSRGVSRLPLGPLLSIPLAALPLVAGGLGAGLPLLLGALMRPLGAALSAAMAALMLVLYDLSFGDGVVPYLGESMGSLPRYAGPAELLEKGQNLLLSYPDLVGFVLLWAAAALLVSVAEWLGLWVYGLALAGGGGMLAYALEVSVTREALLEAVTSLGLASIMYGVIRYFGSRFVGG